MVSYFLASPILSVSVIIFILIFNMSVYLYIYISLDEEEDISFQNNGILNIRIFHNIIRNNSRNDLDKSTIIDLRNYSNSLI